MNALTRSQTRVLGRTVAQLAVSGGLLCLLQLWLAPGWLVSSTTGLSTLLQVVVATIVALYVLILGSVFVIAEHTTKAYSARTVPLLLIESRVQYQLVRALFLAIAALLLSGRVPAGEHVPDLLAAAAATVALATATLLPLSALALAGLASGTVDAREFTRTFLLEKLSDELREGRLPLLAYKLDVLGDMLAVGVRQRDRALLDAAVDGLLAVQRTWYDVGSATPGAAAPSPAIRAAEHLCEAATDAVDLAAPASMRATLLRGIDAGAAAAAEANDESGLRAFDEARVEAADAGVA